MSQGQMSESTAQMIIVGLVLAYGIPGGIIAAYATDIIQGLLIVVLSFLLLPFAAEAIGGMDRVVENVPPDMLGITSEGVFSPGWIFWFVVGATFSAFSWTLNAAYGGARNEIAARLSVAGGILKRFCTLGWVCVGLFALAYYTVLSTGEMPPADRVFADLTRDALPIGLTGLMLAAVLAAIMSTADAGMVNTASILVNNIYRPYFKPKASAKHYLLMARVFGASIMVLGWGVATQIDSLVDAIVILEIFGSVVGVSVVAAFMWRRTTAAGAIASVAIMSVLFWYGNFYVVDMPKTISTPLYLIPGIVTLVVVSLMTRHHNIEMVDEFYARLDTPVGEEHRLREKGIQVDLLDNLDENEVVVSDQDHDVSKRLIMLDLLRLPKLLKNGEAKLSDYWIDGVGFVGFSIFVALFLWGTGAFMQWLFT